MERHMDLTFEVAAITDIGCKRQNNEDSFGYDQSRQVYVVCDGMGGMAGGEIASQTAVHKILEIFGEAAAHADHQGPVEELLYDAILRTNQEVRALALSNLELHGMGTTLVAACLDGHRIVIGNVGDSRAYFLRQGECVQITRDHSFISEQLLNGTITPEMAASSPLQSVITRAIGIEDLVQPDLFGAELEPGDRILLTTDGLTRYVDAAEIARLTAMQENLQVACQILVDIAKDRGAADNVTCLFLQANPR
jgi:serine/threonine protein phosphatase PrpC